MGVGTSIVFASFRPSDTTSSLEMESSYIVSIIIHGIHHPTASSWRLPTTTWKQLTPISFTGVPMWTCFSYRASCRRRLRFYNQGHERLCVSNMVQFIIIAFWKIMLVMAPCNSPFPNLWQFGTRHRQPTSNVIGHLKLCFVPVLRNSSIVWFYYETFPSGSFLSSFLSNVPLHRWALPCWNVVEVKAIILCLPQNLSATIPGSPKWSGGSFSLW